MLKHSRHGKYDGFHKTIEKEAYFIALRDSFRNSQDYYWNLAEKKLLYDSNSNVNKQTEILKKINEIFFNQVDKKQSKEDIAKDYLFFVRENERFLKLATLNFSNRLSNIALATTDYNLDFIAKRNMLISENPIVGFSGECNTIYEQDEGAFRAYDISTVTAYQTNCPDLEQLGNWLIACEPLLCEGLLTYIPTLVTEDFDTNGAIRYSSNNISNDLVFDAVISNKNVSFLNEPSLKKSRTIMTIANVEIPIIDQVSTKDWANITIDEYDSFLKFKLLIKEMLCDLIIKENQFDYNNAIEKAGISLEKGFKLLDNDLRKHKIKNTVNTIGGILGTITASLIAINTNLFENAGKIIGSSGTIATLLNLFNQNYDFKIKAEGSEYYYLFLLGRKLK